MSTIRLFFILSLAAQSYGAETAAVKILKEHCVSCHGGETPIRYLDLSTREGVLRGGAMGPAVIPGNFLESLVYRVLTHEANMPQMPKDKQKLSDADIKIIKNWIEDGAPWEEPDKAEKEKPAK